MAKNDILHTFRILDNFIKDKDLRFISGQMVKGLEVGISAMEKIMKDYGIPFPMRPPAGSKTTGSLEHFTDKYIYESLLEGIHTFFPLLSQAFMSSTTPQVRKVFKDHLLRSMELQELIVEYGKLKGLLYAPPIYRA